MITLNYGKTRLTKKRQPTKTRLTKKRQPTKTRLTKKTKIFIVIGICLLVIGYLAYTGIRDLALMKSSMTVSELFDNNASPPINKGLRVRGRVVDGSIKWDVKMRQLSFQIADQKRSVTVVYGDVAPDNFKSGMNVIVEGIYTGNGLFRASKIMPTCPSKYVSDKNAAAP